MWKTPLAWKAPGRTSFTNSVLKHSRLQIISIVSLQETFLRDLCNFIISKYRSYTGQNNGVYLNIETTPSSSTARPTNSYYYSRLLGFKLWQFWVFSIITIVPIIIMSSFVGAIYSHAKSRIENWISCVHYWYIFVSIYDLFRKMEMSIFEVKEFCWIKIFHHNYYDYNSHSHHHQPEFGDFAVIVVVVVLVILIIVMEDYWLAKTPGLYQVPMLENFFCEDWTNGET